jgi:3-hydroxybutyryl-CoA dehydrogenase
MTNYQIGNLILSFGHSSKDEKKSYLGLYPNHDIFMDLTCFDPAEFYAEFPQLKGSFAALFCDQSKRIEVHLREKNEDFIKHLKALGFLPFEIGFASCGFIFPRTIVQIINEAYFALEEKVASPEDINRAMLFGVNYPKGPFEWSQGKEAVVVTLLDELLKQTGDPRYRASSILRDKA